MKLELTPLLIALLVLTGCSTGARNALFGDPRDRPYDPNYAQGQQLFDQIPNTEGEANRICCGHLRECKPYQSPRC